MTGASLILPPEVEIRIGLKDEDEYIPLRFQFQQLLSHPCKLSIKLLRQGIWVSKKNDGGATITLEHPPVFEKISDEQWLHQAV